MTRPSFVSILCAYAAAASLAAQTARFSTGVAAVRVDVLVTDRGRPVTGLARADFELRDNGVAQAVTDVSFETLPLNLLCVLDLSGSVTGSPLANLKDGLRALIDALAPADRAALITFSQRLQLHTRLTGDTALLHNLVEDVKSGGDTSVIDAAFAGLALREADEGRTLMLLFSDGRDTASWLPARTVLEAARRTDVIVYPVTVRVTNSLNMNTTPLIRQRGFLTVPAGARPVPGADEGIRLLDAFADDTGGRMFFAEGEGGLRKTFLDVLAEFRQRYVVGYTPTGVPADGWHTIEVKLRGRSGQVKARRGYFGVTPGAGARTPPK
jgi:VWFA-related protein